MALLRLRDSESAQGSFEYVLVVGGVSIAVILAVASPSASKLVQAVSLGACDAVGLAVPAPACGKRDVERAIRQRHETGSRPRGHVRSAPVPPKLALHRSEEGQGGLEYMLVLGGAAVAMVVALLAFDTVVAQILGHICPSVDTANPLAAIGDCIT